MNNLPYFLRLPRELPDEIYLYYVQTDDDDGGLHYNFNTGKLLTSYGKTVDVSLQYTCRQIALEMQGVVFRQNKITFTTTPDLSRRVLRYSCLMRMQMHALTWMLESCAFLITPELLGQIALRHPNSAVPDALRKYDEIDRKRALISLLDTMNSYGPKAPRSAGSHISTNAEFERLTGEHEWRSRLSDREQDGEFIWDGGWREEAIEWTPVPYLVPNDEELEKMQAHFRQPLIEELEKEAEEWNTSFFFSGATAAIHFLGRLAETSRLSVRRVVIREDRKTYTFAETHGQGLLPFLCENPCLRIERRLDLPRAILPNRFTPLNHYDERHVDLVHSWDGAKLYRAVDIVGNLKEWIDEATRLYVDDRRYSLVLEGPPEVLQYVWGCVKTAAAGQEAAMLIEVRRQFQGLNMNWMDESRFRQGIACPLSWQWHEACYVSPTFPQAIRDIKFGKSIILIDTDLGELWDAEELIRNSLEVDANGNSLSYEPFTSMVHFIEAVSAGRTSLDFLSDEDLDCWMMKEWIEQRNSALKEK
ncbi:hypothetical protein BDV96DRAFT_639462 [Lophiotrema nucula]|uniref:Uncharacterized protein n=1 Tax=Lophiotrema nucula TaxID=690887 RepID=A0A6A5ZVV7_9PLEO|nr:hypothetical protein BDV96DRAFT_639462 [Lophiotrema nucula]